QVFPLSAHILGYLAYPDIHNYTTLGTGLNPFLKQSFKYSCSF
ncbi:uncharacterized protein METZ01_LOCUS421647, partial [marine metagenome]